MDTQDAVRELMHSPELAQLEGVPALSKSAVWIQTHLHDGSQTDEDDPFDIAYE